MDTVAAVNKDIITTSIERL